MPISEIVDYIHTRTQEGASAQELRATLMAAGWHESDIENGLRDVAIGLHPATPGASIHEDLAQVRGMVAHLATRLQGIETTVASLPTSFIGPDHELMESHKPGFFGRALSLTLTILATVGLGLYGADAVPRGIITAQDYQIMLGAIGALFAVVSMVLIRRYRAWSGWLLCGGAVALWITDIVLAWRI